MIAYISGPLHAVVDIERARELYERLGAVCERNGWQAYVPHQHTDPILHADVFSESVYERDFYNLHRSAVVIAHIGAPSSGVGAELAFAVVAKIPIIALYRDGESPSRFILGMLKQYVDALVVRCSTDREFESQVEAALVRQELRMCSRRSTPLQGGEHARDDGTSNADSF